MLQFFRKKNTSYEDKALIVLDIGTDMIKALLLVHEGKEGGVIGVGKHKQKLGDMQSGQVTDIGSVIHHCQEAIAEAEKMAGISGSQLIIGIAGEMVKGSTVVIDYVRPNPDTKIDFEELKTIIHKLQWKAFDSIRSYLAQETGYNEIDIKLVHAAITDVRIDGYKVKNPIGFQGKDMSICFFNAFAPLVHFGALQTIAAELGMDLLAITAEPYALSRCISHGERNDFHAIFIDIGGGTTDIAIVKDGSLVATKMFTLGGHTFTKRLSQSLNISFDEAEEIKLAYSNQELEKHSEKIVREAIQRDSEIWLSGVALSLAELRHIETLPLQFFLCGGGSRLPEMKQTLESRDWVKSLPFARKPQIEFLEPKQIYGIHDHTKRLKTPQEITPMALASLSLEFSGEERILSKMLNKVVRLMQV